MKPCMPSVGSGVKGDTYMGSCENELKRTCIDADKSSMQVLTHLIGAIRNFY